MQKAQSNIYLLFNIGISNYSFTFLIILTHYINNNIKFQIILIELYQVIGFHFDKIIIK